MIDTNAGLRIVNEGKFTFVRNQNKLVNMNLEHGARPFPVLDFFNVPENLARTAAIAGARLALEWHDIHTVRSKPDDFFRALAVAGIVERVPGTVGKRQSIKIHGGHGLGEVDYRPGMWLGEMAYSLANGQGKGTMTRDRESRAKLSWRLLTLSSGERSLSEHAAISGNSAHAGAELRMVDVNAGTRTHRAFDELHGLAGADFHRQLTVAVGDHHGHLGLAFVEKLIGANDKPGLLSDFAGVRAQFVEDNAQAGRVADRFAVIALAGEMAIAWGLLPWGPGTALADCKLLYGEWLARVGGGNAEDRQILAGIQDFVDKHGSSRFSDVDAPDIDAKVFNRAGYWEAVGGKRLYLFNKSALIEAAHGFGLSRVVSAIEAAGALAKHDTDRESRKTKKYRTPGNSSARLYVVDLEAFDVEVTTQ